MFTCEICKRSFASKKSLASHKNHHNPNYKEKSKKGYEALLSAKSKENRKTTFEEKKYKKWSEKEHFCLGCTQKLEYPNTTTCSNKCQKIYRSKANTRTVSETTKSKISVALKGKYIKVAEKECVVCGVIHPYKNRKTCSKDCHLILKRKTKKEGYKLYKHLCGFNFNLSDFPKEFDFSLIEEHGWYKAKNRGDNPNGVSRDHILSVRYGFDSNIDPSIVRHPANCRLMLHAENNSKKTRCDISLEELLEKIAEWNKKYSDKM
jgi:predicted nucleic acid-binding Zn ribbon protein